MEESDIALLDLASQREGRLAVQTWSEIDSSLRKLRKQDSRLRIWQLLCARCNRVSNLPRSEVERLGPRRYLLRLCLGLGRQPTLVYKGLNSLLLLKVQGEERMADLAKFVLRFAVVKITPETLQLEETTGGQTHNGRSATVQRWVWTKPPLPLFLITWYRRCLGR